MPTYRYTGDVPFTDLNYDLFDVEPNSVVKTKWSLPSNWKSFEFIDVDPADGFSHSQDYTVTSAVEVYIADHSKIIIKLKNADQASLSIHLGQVLATPVILDASVPYYTLSMFNFDKLYLAPQSGQPEVRIYFLDSGEKVL